MGLTVERIEILLLIAAVVAMLAQRLRLPYTVGLVLAGAGLAFSSYAPQVLLTKHLIFMGFLPPLLFEAALAIEWPALRRDLVPVMVLATLGVLFSAGLTAVGMQWAAGWEWPIALLFGVLIAATDPVSVIATFKQTGLKGRVTLLVEAESLLNDGTAAVGFVIALALAQGQSMGAFEAVQAFCVSFFGGVLCGATVGLAVIYIAGKTDDHLMEITFTTVAAYGSFLLAEHFHLSGVLSTMTTGLIIGNTGHICSFTDKGREAVESFWEYAAFVANSLIFLLMGLQMAHQPYRELLVPVGAAILLVTLGRAVAVYPCCVLFTRSDWRVTMRHQHILFWGGLRGALALALALGLPTNLPHRDEIVTTAFGVVAFSVIVQGLTIKPLLRRLGEIGKE